MRTISRVPHVYIGIDPGKVTGIASYDLTVPDRPPRALALFPLETADELDNLLSEYIGKNYNVVVAVERYTMGSTIRTQQPEALETIGMVKWIVSTYQRIPSVPAKEDRPPYMIFQGASDAAAIGTRDNMTKAGWWIRADKDQHRNKAMAHVALAMLRYEPQRWSELLEKGS